MTTMEWISVKWLLILACASIWTIFFSMFSTPRIRGWRNLGWLMCFIVGVIMLFALPWRPALVTWAVAAVFSGLVYFAYESFAYLRARDKARAQLLVVDLDPDVVVGRVAGFRNGDVGPANLAARDRGDLARQTDHREEVAAIGLHVDIQHAS